MVSKKEVINFADALRIATEPSDENLEILLSYFFVWFKPMWLRKAIKEWIDPITIFERYTQGRYKKITKGILSLWWDGYLNDFLSSAPKLYNYLSRDPEIKKILDTEEGRKYLNYITERIYDWAYKIVSED